MVHTGQSYDQGPVLCAGSLILWVVVVFFLMLCTFGIGAASGELSRMHCERRLTLKCCTILRYALG